MIIDLIYRSDVVDAPPKDLGFKFNSLWQMSETERATIAVGITSAVTQAFDAGVIDRPCAMKELKQSADVTGVWSNITNEDVEEAEADPPPPKEGQMDVPELPNSQADQPDDGQTAEREVGLDQGA